MGQTNAELSIIMTQERKITFGQQEPSTDLAEMPEGMRDWMKLKQGEFTTETYRNGAVLISPKQDENSAEASDIPQDQDPV